jgi:hypothetical protein
MMTQKLELSVSTSSVSHRKKSQVPGAAACWAEGQQARLELNCDFVILSYATFAAGEARVLPAVLL